MKLILSLLLLLPQGSAAFPIRGQGEARTVMVQLFEWPWRSVAEECEKVLGPAGFAAVQVSPPTEHVVVPGSPWWERYQPVSHKLHSRSGTEREFADMVRRCGRVGVDIYADVILNHMAGRHEGVGFAGSRFTHYEYPGLFYFGDFHHCGRNGNDDIVDFHDLYELQNCELLNLADLHTGRPEVQGKLARLLDRLLQMGVAGFRIDAAKHMAAQDIAGIFSRARRPFYAVHELIISPGEPVSVEPYLPLGDVNVFPYAYAVGRAFLSGDLGSLPGIARTLGVGSSDAVVFLENHDLERRPPEESLLPFLKQPELHRLGLVFLLTYPYGYPQLYSGYSFRNYDDGPPLSANGTSLPVSQGRCNAPWTCAHRDRDVLALVNFRNRTDRVFEATRLSQPKPGVLAYGRGALGHVVLNAGKSFEQVMVPTDLPPGRYCNLVGEGCRQEGVVDAKGVLRLGLKPRSSFVVLAP